MRKTRHQKAAELIARLNCGPSIRLLGHDVGGRSIGNAESAILEIEINRRVRGWIESWVKQDVLDLVPELDPRRPIRRPRQTKG